MGLTFGVSVSVNNLLALRGFYTFIFNYQLHEKPTFIEKWFLPRLKAWVEKRALVTLMNLIADKDAQGASVSLNDVSGDFFAVLYLAHNQHLMTEVKTGQSLFLLLAQMALEFEKLRKPHLDSAGYK